ncbi:MAG TPA: outer membrane beta-barrel protein [Saprospiraceae bacterium]|nr:outer membrane beta-barrel protein [Saprospiraceae bacterium]
MKKNLLLFALVLFCLTAAQAQVGPGLFVGGDIGISTNSSEATFGGTTTDGPETFNFNISPAVGYYFNDNVAAGVRIGFGNSTTTQPNDDESSSTTFSIGVFGRYASTIDANGNFAWFLEANAGFGSQTSETVSGNTTIEGDPVSTVGVGIAPGLIYFPAPKFGFEVSLGNVIAFQNRTVEDANNSDNETVSNSLSFLDLGTMGLNLGFNYYFDR